MTPYMLNHIRRNILRSLSEIHGRTRVARQDLIRASEAQTGVNVERIEHARDEGEMNTHLELHNRDLKLRDQLYAALLRISNGTFGDCEECEEYIDIRRLLAQPAARFCFHCQSAKEGRRAVNKVGTVILEPPGSINLESFGA